VCQDCGPNNNGRAQEECGDNINVARVEISSFILWHENTFVSSFNQRTGKCGLIHTRWMYHVEHYLKTLKG
jgi:hypothetical protein